MARDVEYMGYFKQRTSDSIVLSTGMKDSDLSPRSNNRSLNKSNLSQTPNSNNQTYRVIKSFPFTSDRKAMSIIVKRPDGKIFIYVKGADSSLMKMSDG